MLPPEPLKSVPDEKPTLLVFKVDGGDMSAFSLSEISGYYVDNDTPYKLLIRLKGIDESKRITFRTTIDRSKAIEKINSYFNIVRL